MILFYMIIYLVLLSCDYNINGSIEQGYLTIIYFPLPII